MRIRLRLLSRASGMLGSTDEAQDALQESFCKLWGRRGDIFTEAQAEGLSMTTVRNTCIDNLRRRRNDVASDAELMQAADDMATEAEDDFKTELLQAVETLIAENLTERQRRILYMRDKAGVEIYEIAEEFGISEANVRMILSRARKTVRECYENLKTKQ